ncbi:MAG: rhamnulokinase [Oscillospiraceae bacterium]|nr:rhamnulokinase [Oscillospiraceae bacterium]
MNEKNDVKYFLAVDIGASGGRCILGWLENGRLMCQEINRFFNGMSKQGGHLCWNTNILLAGIISGLRRCAEIGRIPVSVGIDTWGVDFVFLDENGRMTGDAVAYRDERTNGMDTQTFACIPEHELYQRTGIQKLSFNTIFQLMAVKMSSPGFPKQAESLLMMPDYLHYRLTGAVKTEYTIATTSGLVNAESKTWDDKIINACGFPRGIFREIAPPGTVLGDLLPEIQEQVGFNCQVILPCTHDTGSAVMAAPSQGDEDTLYISSGTWSLLGVERLDPDCSETSMKAGFSNEGGYGYRYRYLKNIMGLWMIQSVRKDFLSECPSENSNDYSYEMFCEMAEQSKISSLVDCNDARFLAPENMSREIQKACKESGEQVPEEPGEFAAVIFKSLAACYRDAIQSLERHTGVTYPAIHIVGGGSNNMPLNKLTAQYTGKTVCAGPTESTAIGNLTCQMIRKGEFSGLEEARAVIRRSFEIKEVLP